jgi:hypothetical protein
MAEPLIPPDRAQCQALRPNRTWSPFNLGPATENPITGEKRGGSVASDRYWRCREKPVCIVQEAKPGADGLQGTMSLCADCFVQACLQLGGGVELIEDLREKETTDGQP